MLSISPLSVTEFEIDLVMSREHVLEPEPETSPIHSRVQVNLVRCEDQSDPAHRHSYYGCYLCGFLQGNTHSPTPRMAVCVLDVPATDSGGPSGPNCGMSAVTVSLHHPATGGGCRLVDHASRGAAPPSYREFRFDGLVAPCGRWLRPVSFAGVRRQESGGPAAGLKKVRPAFLMRMPRPSAYEWF